MFHGMQYAAIHVKGLGTGSRISALKCDASFSSVLHYKILFTCKKPVIIHAHCILYIVIIDIIVNKRNSKWLKLVNCKVHYIDRPPIENDTRSSEISDLRQVNTIAPVPAASLAIRRPFCPIAALGTLSPSRSWYQIIDPEA
jgi:hypothetical protein